MKVGKKNGEIREKGQSGKIKMWTFKDGEMEQEGGEMQRKKDRREKTRTKWRIRKRDT